MWSVHAKAAGATGEFEVLEDLSDITDANFLSEKGKKTPMLMRISTVGGEKGSADTVRDVRGWSTKLYTEEGIQDFVFNDLPVFFIREPIKFPSMNRSHKRHPRTNVPDNAMFWDYHVNNPEGIHALMHLFGQRGIPASLRHINGFGVHTYTLNKADGSYVYVKWHYKPEGGIETMDSETAARLAGTDPDYHVKDLFNAIEKDIEQACFSPSNMVPGIGPSADPVLQARMFSYPDAHRYRVGPNYFQLPPNRPRNQVYAPYVRDGPGTMSGNYGGDPDYVFSQLRPVNVSKRVQVPTHEHFDGKVTSVATEFTDKDYEQARDLWKIICGEEKGKQQIFDNIAPTFKDLPVELQDYLAGVDAEIKKTLTAQMN
ncbi:hypothetical protein ACHAPY_008579 [Fusarium culmorum]